MSVFFRCDHCGRTVSQDDGAFDRLERVFGPICDDCAAQWTECGACTDGWVNGVSPAEVADDEVGDCLNCDGIGFVEKGAS